MIGTVVIKAKCGCVVYEEENAYDLIGTPLLEEALEYWKQHKCSECQKTS